MLCANASFTRILPHRERVLGLLRDRMAVIFVCNTHGPYSTAASLSSAPIHIRVT